jgi:hypothetical protein
VKNAECQVNDRFPGSGIHFALYAFSILEIGVAKRICTDTSAVTGRNAAVTP